MYDRLSEPVRQALVLAADEARNLGHERIGTEHLLLGLIRHGDGETAATGLTLARGRQEVRAMLGGSGRRTIGELQFTTTARDALEAAGERAGPGGAEAEDLLATLRDTAGSGAAEMLGGRPDDDGNLLLELAAKPGSVTARALTQLGVDRDRLERAVELVRRR